MMCVTILLYFVFLRPNIVLLLLKLYLRKGEGKKGEKEEDC